MRPFIPKPLAHGEVIYRVGVVVHTICIFPPLNGNGILIIITFFAKVIMGAMGTDDSWLYIIHATHHSLSQKGIWASFGHPNPQKSPLKHPNFFVL